MINSQTKGCLACVAAFAVGMIPVVIGRSQKDAFEDSEVMWLTIIVLAIIVCVGLWYNKHNSNELEIVQQRREQLNAITKKYNIMVQKIPEDNAEESYQKLKQEYETERQTLRSEWENSSPELKISKIWPKLMKIGFGAILFFGLFTLGLNIEEDEEPDRITALMDNRSWNAENIPMPHMTDHSQYVSNPDSILSPEVVDSINVTLEQLDDILGVESAMIIVGHIDGDDPFRMAQDVGNKYGVGRNDRGLVIVVGYLDHSYSIAPGRSLEGDLTDLECNHLAQDYLIPSMKVEQPDSGMLYLAKGIYAMLDKKEMPQMAALTSSTNGEESKGMVFWLYPFMLIAWAFFYSYMIKKVTTTAGLATLLACPFATFNSYDGGGGHLGGGFSSRRSGGGFSSGGSRSRRSGGYGGGSFGGGGASGRW
ncbi:MAG: TPM domain-containing protein [Prevotella sp.]|nr:TPM domain-containing protein [Prevotella sp.]